MIHISQVSYWVSNLSVAKTSDDEFSIILTPFFVVVILILIRCNDTTNYPSESAISSTVLNRARFAVSEKTAIGKFECYFVRHSQLHYKQNICSQYIYVPMIPSIFIEHGPTACVMVQNTVGHHFIDENVLYTPRFSWEGNVHDKIKLAYHKWKSNASNGIKCNNQYKQSSQSTQWQRHVGW